MGSRSLYRRFITDVQAAELPHGPGDESPVTEAEIAPFDAPVQRYLRFMHVVGHPRVWSLQSHFVGRFRMRADGPWMPAEAWQYNTRIATARVFTMRLRLARVVPMIGSDTYVRGRGRMLGKLLGIVKVADGSGEEFDIGELSTYLNDAILLAPSMLLGPETTWSATGPSSFDVTVRDAGRSVTAHVTLDERGAPVDFATTDRFASLPQGLVRARWRTPVPVWTTIDDRPFPGAAKAIWDLDDGPFTYIDGHFVPESVTFNLSPPDEESARATGLLARDSPRDLALGIRGAAAMTAALATPFRRRERARWGVDEAIAARALPGDDLVAEPSWQWTHGIEVDAPASTVWPWVAQIGADRAGFYSYQWLENLVGCNVHNAGSIHPEWMVQPGDRLLLHPKMPALPVVIVQPGRCFVAHAGPDRDAGGAKWVTATWLFLVEPISSDRCRVISRYRCATSDDLATRLSMGPAIVEPLGFVMDRQMLLGIKARAERRSPHTRSA